VPVQTSSWQVLLALYCHDLSTFPWYYFTGWLTTKEQDVELKSKGYAPSYRDLPPSGGPEEKEFLLPYSFFEDQKKYDLTVDTTSNSKPKMFVYGAYDKLATPETVKETYNLFAEPKLLYKLESDHDYRLFPDLVEEVNRLMKNFLRTIKS
jgi:hypothetical protein